MLVRRGVRCETLQFLLLFSWEMWKWFSWSQGHISHWPHPPLSLFTWCNIMLWLPFPRVLWDDEHRIMSDHSGAIDTMLLLLFCVAPYILFFLEVLFSASLAHFYEHFKGIKLVSNWNGREIEKLFCMLRFSSACFFFHLYFKNIIEASDETIYFSHSDKRTWIYVFFPHTFTWKPDLYIILKSPFYSRCNAKLPFWMELCRFFVKYELKKYK